MNNKDEIQLVPKIRFPEFKKSGKWEEKKFSKLFEFKPINVYSRDQLSYDNGLIKNIHYGDIHTKFRTLFDITKERVPFINENQDYNNIKKESYCKEGDIIFADASEDTSDVGKSIEIVNLNGQKIVSGLHTIFARPIIDNFIIGFNGYLFKSNFIRKQIQRESQGTKVYSISTGRLSNIIISYPINKSEQQKIADCLSSLDECISAETRKLESLRLHKKGLMQNLFPAEGESVPKLRFPEFKKSGKWEEKKLGDVFSIFQGFAFSSNDTVNKGVRWLKIADVGIQSMDASTPSYLPTEYKELYKKFLVNIGDYVIALTRPFLNKKLKVSRVNQMYDGALLNQRVGKLESDQNIDFVYCLLQTSNLICDIEKKIAGNDPPNLSVQQIGNISIYIPPLAEQQKIADCLSSLDECISSQSQKIESLKLHKKGLMQQLFPSMEDRN